MTQNLYIFLAFALAVIGGVLGSSLGRSHRRLCALISLGAGTLFGVTVFGILAEGLALGALLLGAGFGRLGTVLRVALVESTTLLGGFLGLLALPHVPEFWLDAVVAHVGGGFLFLAVHAVGGEILHQHKALVLGNFAAGVALIGTITLLLRLH